MSLLTQTGVECEYSVTIVTHTSLVLDTMIDMVNFVNYLPLLITV